MILGRGSLIPRVPDPKQLGSSELVRAIWTQRFWKKENAKTGIGIDLFPVTVAASEVFRLFLFIKCAFCAHVFGLSCFRCDVGEIVVMVDSQDRTHDGVSQSRDAPAA